MTPLPQNNGQIYNLLYSHTAGPWTISPYLQYTSVPTVRAANGAILSLSADTWGVAVLTKYNFTPVFSVAGRLEYISSSGHQNLLFGPGSNAWSFTITPTYQKGIFFARAEVSYVSIGSGDSLPMGTSSGNSSTTVRRSAAWSIRASNSSLRSSTDRGGAPASPLPNQAQRKVYGGAA